MSADGRVFDGHLAIFGQDSDTEPSFLSASIAAKAVNRVFRGGRNKARPPLYHIPFNFDDTVSPEQQEIIRHGNIQGGFAYRRRKPSRNDGLVLAIAGKIFFFTLVNEKWSIKLVADGNDPKLLHTWFEQAEEWLYIQDGDKLPWFWDGQYPSFARRSLGTESGEMPIGTIMRYIHGRIFLSNAFDQIAASDVMYGGGFTNSINVQKFTENKYWSEGGYFGLPSNLGMITGMVAIARQSRGNTRGQGELLITSIDGGQVIEAGVLRALWKDEQVQSIALIGRGCVSPYSLINVNNDAFFRSDDGLASYRVQISEQNQNYAFSKISSFVNEWFEQDTPDLLQFTSSIYFDNRVLTTVSPQLHPAINEEWGSHRFSRGIISLDLDRASRNPGDADYNFDGLWTGIRPVMLLNGRFGNVVRAFAPSHDKDGENRIYEIRRGRGNDSIEGQAVKKRWFYYTKKFSWLETGKSNQFEVKRLVGGEVWLSDVHDRIKIKAHYRSDNIPFWTKVLDRDFGSEPVDWTFSQPRYKRFKFESVKDLCVPGAPYLGNHGALFQIKIEGEGDSKVDMMRIAVAQANDTNATVSDCSERVDNPETVLDGETDNDYIYYISDYLT